MKLGNAMRRLSRGGGLIWTVTISGARVEYGGTAKGLRRHFTIQRIAYGFGDRFIIAASLGETMSRRPILSLISRQFARRTHQSQWPRTTLPTTTQPLSTAATTTTWHIAPPIRPTADLDANSAPPEQLRSVMRLLSQSVVVCTSTHGNSPRAMTMSSFTSLTLSPTPVVTFNVAVPSRTLDAISTSRQFNIHILAGNASGAAVADHFTRGNMDGDVFKDLENVTYKQEEPAPQDTVAGAPILQGNGILHVLKCRVLDDAPSSGLMRVRDHVIIAGEVVEMVAGSGTREFSLAYADRRYRQVGRVIVKQ